MNNFERKGKELYCEEVSLEELARTFGTPLYVYSHTTLSRHYNVFDSAFDDFPHIVCFAVKSNPRLAILNLLSSMGAGADIVSGGELFCALRAGILPEKIVFSGVGKSGEEMEQALEAGILMFNVESIQELYILDSVAGKMGRRARISFRVNPDIDPKTHPYVSTGLKTSKFGIPVNEAICAYQEAGKLKHIDVIGVDCHIGSQLTEISPFVQAVKRMKELVFKLRKQGFNIQYLDMGGGLGIEYHDESPPTPAEYCRALRKELDQEGITLILEPGRNLIGNAGVLVSRVLYTKESETKKFVVVDAGMNNLIRPSLYGSYHSIIPLFDEGRKEESVDVVGPICESGDFLARERVLPELRQDDLLAVMSAGAYGSTMASTYNSRPLAAEVLVKGKDYFLIRKRGAYKDLTFGEQLFKL